MPAPVVGDSQDVLLQHRKAMEDGAPRCVERRGLPQLVSRGEVGELPPDAPGERHLQRTGRELAACPSSFRELTARRRRAVVGAPAPQRRLRLGAREELQLPLRQVGVLRPGRRRLGPAQARRIDPHDVADEACQPRAVGAERRQRQDERRALVVQLGERGGQQRPVLDVEDVVLGAREEVGEGRLLPGGRRGAKRALLDVRPREARDDLERRAHPRQGTEPCSQDLVPLDRLRQRRMERSTVERTVEPHQAAGVVRLGTAPADGP